MQTVADVNYYDMDNKVSVTIILLFTVIQNTVAVSVKEHDEVTLVCPLEGNYEYPTWTGPETLETPLMTGIDFNEPYIRWAHANKQDITILAANLKHDGTYICEDNTGRNASIQLSVEYFQNTNIAISPEIATEENNRITLTCSVYSNPDADIDIQFRSGRRMENTTRTDCQPDPSYENRNKCNIMSTFIASKHDNGEAQGCRFISQDGETTKTRNVEIHFEFPPTTITIHGNKPIRSGSSIDLTCSTDSSNPVSNITWRQGENGTAQENAVLEENSNPIVTDAEFHGKSITDSIIVEVANEMNGQYVFCCTGDALCDNVTLDINITSTGDIVMAWMALLAAGIALAAGSKYV